MSKQPKPWFRKELSEIKLVRRIGKVRDVARKMLDKSTDRHAECYRYRMTTGLLGHMSRIVTGLRYRVGGAAPIRSRVSGCCSGLERRRRPTSARARPA